MEIKDFSKNNWRPTFYAIFLPELKEIAYDCGYALGLHGSMGSDMDLMAVPWVETLKPVEEMVERMCEACGVDMRHLRLPKKNEKFYGREVYSLVIAIDRYIDLSIMPAIDNVIHSLEPEELSEIIEKFKHRK